MHTIVTLRYQHKPIPFGLDVGDATMIDLPSPWVLPERLAVLAEAQRD
jgi:hypothetical protein